MRITNIQEEIKAYLEWSPLSLVIREVCRLHSFRLQLMAVPSSEHLKVLDVGCGDGKWWQYLKKVREIDVYGIDINTSEIEKSQKFINASVSDITDIDSLKHLPKNFDMVVGNCSLEHVPNINLALSNIHSLIKDHGIFILYVPTPTWALKGKSIDILEKISPRLSMAYSGMVNGFFQHWHLYHYEIWSHLLSNNGFEVKEVKGIGSKKLEFLFRLFLPSSFISFIVKIITGKYLNYYMRYLIPSSLKNFIAQKLETLVNDSQKAPDDVQEIFEYMIISRKLP
jgi:2-polyprenyl-3-methyl-5-hydroxy-6-metoxy-1,4-benzoquinol methylase